MAGDIGKPLDGITILALEQMQALPHATQLLARLGANVIKVEDPERGDSARASQPRVMDGTSPMGPTFLRNNLNKRSIAIDIRSPQGRDLVLDLAEQVDIICENLGPGRARKFGLGYEACAARNKRLIYLSISGFGETGESPYQAWPAYASVVEAMGGIYDHVREPNRPPLVNPSIALGDTVTGLYGVIGILAALQHRSCMGEGQYIDLAMFDAMVAINEVMFNFWSMGVRKDENEVLRVPGILAGFRASDGWFTLFVGREHQFDRFAKLIGRPDLLTDPRLQDRNGWFDHTEDVIRPAVEAWAATLPKAEAARLMAEAGVAAAPCFDNADLIADAHVQARAMIHKLPRPGGGDPILVAGNPVKLSKMPEGPERWYPKLGEHTDAVLSELLGPDAARRAKREG